MPASSLWKIRPCFMTPPYGMLASHNPLLRFPFAARPSTFSFLPPPEGEGEKEEGAPQNFFLAQDTGVFSWAEAKPFLSETLSTCPSTGLSIRPICVDVCASEIVIFKLVLKHLSFFSWRKAELPERQHMTIFYLKWAQFGIRWAIIIFFLCKWDSLWNIHLQI